MDYRFQVNLGGIINLLSNNLYSGPQVFLRELLQNAVDAIAARRLAEPDFAGGRIQLELMTPAGAPPTLCCEDNGVGLTAEEVHRFLATIGESSKRDDLGVARADFIGQFGIGLLSCFMVADEIVMITQPLSGGPPTEWKGRPDGTYSVRQLEKPVGVGTRVYLRCKKGRDEYFTLKRVRELATHFGGLLPHDVRVVQNGQSWSINEPAVWERTDLSDVDRRIAMLEYGRTTFGVDLLDWIPLKSAAGEATGVAFVLAQSPSPTAKGRHRIYLKRMLLTEAGEGILPEWAFFVRCAINANALRPTASREGFYEDSTLEAARDSLGDALRNHLIRLAKEDQARLQRYLAVHHLAIKALAIHDDEFYHIFIDWISFETTLGTMTMAELRREHPTVTYVRTVDEFRQIARIAAAQDVCIVNAGYTYCQDLIEKLPEVFPDVEVVQTDAVSIAQSFEELTLDQRDECFDLVRIASLALQPFKCAADVRRFQPSELAALYSTDPDGYLLRSVEQVEDMGESPLTSALDSILSSEREKVPAQLLLNYSNSLVRKLTKVQDKPTLVRSIQMLYVQALLLGHRPLTSRELSLLNEGLSGLIEAAIAPGKGGNQ